MAKTKFQTPIGTGRYCWIARPDTQFDSEGVYGTQLILSEKDAEDILQLLKDEAKEAFKPNAKVSMPVDRDSETGDVTIRTKSKYQPKVFDARGQVIPESDIPAIYSGSKLRLKGVINPYTVQGKSGLTLLVQSVQIVELSEGAGEGFDAVDGGFVLERTEKDADTFEDDDFGF